MSLQKSSLKDIGESFIERAVDAVLVMLYFNLEVAPLLRNKRYLIDEKVEEDLEKFNYQTLKRALRHLKQNGFIQTIKEKDSLPKITKLGERRLENILPFYDEERIWDGKIYLVTYDIPESKRKVRNYLRGFLKRIGCGMLQQSIWVTPYNPTIHVKEFIEEQSLDDGLVLVSSIGKNGTVGQLTLPDLIEKVYKLSALNQRYLEFIKISKGGKASKSQLIFLFLSILKDDPQLPFSLLAKDWVGDKAYQIFKKLQISNSNL